MFCGCRACKLPNAMEQQGMYAVYCSGSYASLGPWANDAKGPIKPKKRGCTTNAELVFGEGLWSAAGELHLVATRDFSANKWQEVFVEYGNDFWDAYNKEQRSARPSSFVPSMCVYEDASDDGLSEDEEYRVPSEDNRQLWARRIFELKRVPHIHVSFVSHVFWSGKQVHIGTLPHATPTYPQRLDVLSVVGPTKKRLQSEVQRQLEQALAVYREPGTVAQAPNVAPVAAQAADVAPVVDAASVHAAAAQAATANAAVPQVRALDSYIHSCKKNIISFETYILLYINSTP